MARAATEYAVLAVLSNDFYKAGAVCIGDKNNPIKGEFGELFTFEVFVKYFGDMGVCSGDAVAVTGLNQGTVLLDVFVSSKPGKATNPINFHKRTLQKL